MKQWELYSGEENTAVPGPTPVIPGEAVTEEVSADVAVVGEGLAGLCAALSARQAGADTIIVTASSGPVGRGGSVFASYSKVMAERGIPRQDLSDFVLQEFAANSFLIDQRKWYTLIDRSEEAMDWLVDIVRAAGCDAVLEDANEADHNSPTYQPPGTHAFVSKDISRAGIGMPLALKALEERYVSLGGRIIRRSPARLLEKTGRRVTGLLVQREDGGYIRVRAGKAVILATGDFSADPAMMKKYCPSYAGYFDCRGDNYDVGFSLGGLFRGEGHRLAMWAGAAWQRTWPCAVMVQGSRKGTNLPYGSHRGLRVNNRGERYCNEDMNGAYTALTTMREPGGEAFAIWGSNYARDIRFRAHGGRRDGPDTPPEKVIESWDAMAEQGKIVKADTLEEIISALGLPRERTFETICRYNQMCVEGRDRDFHKKPEYLQQIREAPFYGASLSDRYFFSVMGGPRTNWKMQICDENDEPIPGLYCVGSMVGDMYANCYDFRIPGQNYGAGLTFGYLTGRRVAEEETV